MKKLNKKLSLKKESIESYNVYDSCNCDCTSYCKDSKSAYRSFKGLQGSIAYHN